MPDTPIVTHEGSPDWWSIYLQLEMQDWLMRVEEWRRHKGRHDHIFESLGICLGDRLAEWLTRTSAHAEHLCSPSVAAAMKHYAAMHSRPFIEDFEETGYVEVVAMWMTWLLQQTLRQQMASQTSGW